MQRDRSAMYFHALATDYDGTIAHDGIVDEATWAALKALKATGRRLIMVTGRELSDLERVCPDLELFDLLVVENGASLYRPDAKSGRPLAPPPPPQFVEALRALKVEPLSVGDAIVATWEPNETVVLDVIRDLGLDLQITFNKGAVMVLPSGINKASGLAAAVEELGLSFHNVVAIGDAENDLAFMRASGCAVAVGNALPAVKDACDLVMGGARGVGVAELIRRLVDDEAGVRQAAIARHRVAIGNSADGTEVWLGPDDGPVLISGSSGGGKSTLATALIERLGDADFQLCICDPEGDYAELDGVVVFGDAKTPAQVGPVADALNDPETNVAVNLLGISVDDRPKLLQKLLSAVGSLYGASGRPHWLFVDEAHHMLPASTDGSAAVPVDTMPVTCFITVHPETLSQAVVASLKTVLCIGEKAQDVIRSICKATDRPVPPLPDHALGFGEVIRWVVDDPGAPIVLSVDKPRQARKRHIRKYADGALGEDRSFFFRGPDGALNLRAQNLMIFLQIADGIDEATFMHHLHAGDYSDWFRSSIKDPELADEVAGIEGSGAVDLVSARKQLREAVERRYTAPADGVA